MRRLEGIEAVEEAARMARSDDWPLHPFLPVKRLREMGEWPELGFMVAEETPVVVYLADWTKPNERRRALSPSPADKPPFVRYESYLAAIADGWMGD